MFTPWVWLTYPDRRFIYCSYAEALALRDSMKARMIIESEEYQELVEWKAEQNTKIKKTNPSFQGYTEPWRLKDDSNQKKKFENTATGMRMSTGVGGSLTGEGGDYLMVDDPLNAMEVTSDVTLEEVNNWHDIAFSSRFNDPKRHAKVIVMQRLHEADLSGHVLSKADRYEKLILPARYNPDSEVKSATSLNYVDPRTKKGELLWPERFTDKAITDLEEDLNNFNSSAEAQLQQDPKAGGGGLFPRENWQYYEGSPSTILDIVQFIDCAQKPGITNDYTVIATWAKLQNGYAVLDLWRGQTTAPLLEEMTKAYYEKWKPSAVVIEDKSAGSSLIQTLLVETEIPVLPFNPGQRDKVVRATAATPTVKAGKVFLPKNAPWVNDFVKEHEKFPVTKHDDQVDTTSMAVEYFRGSSSEPRIRSL